MRLRALAMLAVFTALTARAQSDLPEAPEGEEALTFDAEMLGQTAWKKRRWGFRLGFFAPGQFDDEGFQSNIAAGAFYQGLQLRDKKIILEIGADYWASSSDSGYVESDVVFLRTEAMFAGWERMGSRRGMYLLGGVGVLAEFAYDTIESKRYQIYEPTIDVGFGWGRARSGWDLRSTYTYLPTSENTQSIVMMTASYAF